MYICNFFLLLYYTEMYNYIAIQEKCLYKRQAIEMYSDECLISLPNKKSGGAYCPNDLNLAVLLLY